MKFVAEFACIGLQKGFACLHCHLKLLQPLEFAFWANFAKRPLRNKFFLGPKNFKGQTVRFTSCKSLFDGYNHFGLRYSTPKIWAFESPESPSDLLPRYVLIAKSRVHWTPKSRFYNQILKFVYLFIE